MFTGVQKLLIYRMQIKLLVMGRGGNLNFCFLDGFKGIYRQRTILILVHKCITPMYPFIYNLWPEFAEFSSYTTNAIQKFYSVLKLD